MLEILSETPFRIIGQKLVKGKNLTFDEAFLGMTFVVGATNRALFSSLRERFEMAHGGRVYQEELRAPAQAFLSGMAQKESYGCLLAEEVAGMVAAAMMDLVVRVPVETPVLETCGMGGDRGFVVNGERRKTINLSTLSALVLAAEGSLVVFKHGSYANTSAIGSTEAIEAFGANIYQKSLIEIKRVLRETNFSFSDAHTVKTIHDLSHSRFLRHETVNHIVGPMTPPLDRSTVLNKIIGVNEGIHPAAIAKAYEILNREGIQRVGNVAVVAGLDEKFDPEEMNAFDMSGIKRHVFLDEFSPYITLLGLVQNGQYIGCYLVRPEDFGVRVNVDKLHLRNTAEVLLKKNIEALKGEDKELANYLAVNAALGLFVGQYLGREDAVLEGQINTAYLEECFGECQQVILSGQAFNTLEKYVESTRGGNVEKNF